MYGDVSIIVEGVLDETRLVRSDGGLNVIVRQLQREANEQGFTAEVYVVWHEHSQGIECECVQYLTDHHPYATVTPKSEAKDEKRSYIYRGIE